MLTNTLWKAWVLLSVSLMVATYAPPARAQSISTGYVTITSMGCNMVSGTAGTACWVNISGPAVGPSGCSGNSIRWDASLTPNGQAALAQLTAAFVAGETVDFDLRNSCWSEWPSYPTIYYYQISQ
jgi:hypothetical protein